MSTIIYLLTNTINGKQYVGQTSCGLNRRWSQHCWEAHRGSTKHLYKAIRKYGTDAFTVEILEQTTIDDVNARETYWIEQLKTLEHGYNLTRGGEGVRGWSPSEETRAKWSMCRKGRRLSVEHRDKIKEFMSSEKHPTRGMTGKNAPFYGKKHSIETRAKMSTAQTGEKSCMYGKKLSIETRAKLSAIRKGKTFTEEHKRKISAARKRYWRMKRISAPLATITINTNRL